MVPVRREEGGVCSCFLDGRQSTCVAEHPDRVQHLLAQRDLAALVSFAEHVQIDGAGDGVLLDVLHGKGTELLVPQSGGRQDQHDGEHDRMVLLLEVAQGVHDLVRSEVPVWPVILPHAHGQQAVMDGLLQVPDGEEVLEERLQDGRLALERRNRVGLALLHIRTRRVEPLLVAFQVPWFERLEQTSFYYIVDIQTDVVSILQQVGDELLQLPSVFVGGPFRASLVRLQRLPTIEIPRQDLLVSEILVEWPLLLLCTIDFTCKPAQVEIQAREQLKVFRFPK